MRDPIVDSLAGRIIRSHNYIEKAVEDLSEEDFCLRPSPTAPPIGWHVWHISRWADMFQASFPEREQVWETEQWLAKISLPPEKLGPLQTGMTMEHDDAALVPSDLGKSNIVDYMQTVFSLNEEIANDLTLQALYAGRESFAKWGIVDEKLVRVTGETVLLIDDVCYHFAHVNRHLGMIEALIGATAGRSGTVSV